MMPWEGFIHRTFGYWADKMFETVFLYCDLELEEYDLLGCTDADNDNNYVRLFID